MKAYQLTLAAENDLREIAQYTIREWGEQQAVQYASAISQTLQSIGSGQSVSRHFSERYPQLRVTRCEHHFIFYLDQKVPCIIAVLHKRMDMLTRLMDRLGE